LQRSSQTFGYKEIASISCPTKYSLFLLPFLHHLLEMKEAWKRQRDCSNTSTGFIVQTGALWRGTSAKELEPTASHRPKFHLATSHPLPLE
jgi:hypothetical protein